jgi:hypothetical protein
LNPIHKDVMTAILGAAGGLGGFVLVFLGVVLSSFGSYSPEAQASVRPRFRLMALSSLTTFGLSIAAMVLSLVWLVLGGNRALYVVALALFGLSLIALVSLAVTVVLREFGD